MSCDALIPLKKKDAEQGQEEKEEEDEEQEEGERGRENFEVTNHGVCGCF